VRWLAFAIVGAPDSRRQHEDWKDGQALATGAIVNRTYDVFISFKNLGENGQPTRDSTLACEVYAYLSARGFSVFFSQASLEHLGIAAYKQAIDDALDSAAVLVAVGTSGKHLESKWVRYEWDSFCNDSFSGVKPAGRVFAYVENTSIATLPRSLRQFQVFQHGPDSLAQLHAFIANAVQQERPCPAGPKAATSDDSIDLGKDSEFDPEDESIPTVWSEIEDEAVNTSDAADGCLTANIVHEHAATGFLADLVVPSNQPAASAIAIRLHHKLLGEAGVRLELRLPNNADSIQYLRLSGVMHGYPVIVRMHWQGRLQGMFDVEQLRGGMFAAASVASGNKPLSKAAVGFAANHVFKSVVPTQSELPQMVRKRFYTSRDGQKALTLTPAILTADQILREFRTLKVRVPAAPKGVAWAEFAFRVDPDGRVTVLARDPLNQMRIVDLVVAG
jgi:hypothetical protein